MIWEEILILLIMVMGLFAIDMLVAKFNLKAGRVVAVLTFFILFPLGLIAGIAALVCMNSKGKQWKFSIIAFLKNVVFHAFLLSIVLIYLVDVILLKIFPDATFPVVFLSFCFSPVVIVFVAKALDCLRDIKRKPKKADVTTENRVNEPVIVNKKKEAAPTAVLQADVTTENRVNEPVIVNEKKEAAPTVALQKTDEGEKKNNTEENHSSKPTGNAYSEPVINSVDDYLARYDPDYQDYLQGNIRLERYGNRHLISGSVKRKYPDEENKVYLSPGRSEIRREEFYGREDMTGVVIPEGVTKISDGAFFNCKNLISVVIPKSVKIIEHNAFLNCENLKEVFICSLRKWCEIDFGMFSNPLNYAEKLYVNGKLLTEFVVPEGIEKINPFVFEGYKSLTKLKITDGVKRIEGYAFAKCTGLTELVFPKSIEYIGNAAFDGCENLEKITFLNRRITIFEGAFESCPKLSNEIKSLIKLNTRKRDLGDYELVTLDDGNVRWVHK